MFHSHVDERRLNPVTNGERQQHKSDRFKAMRKRQIGGLINVTIGFNSPSEESEETSASSYHKN